MKLLDRNARYDDLHHSILQKEQIPAASHVVSNNPRGRQDSVCSEVTNCDRIGS